MLSIIALCLLEMVRGYTPSRKQCICAVTNFHTNSKHRKGALNGVLFQGEKR